MSVTRWAGLGIVILAATLNVSAQQPHLPPASGSGFVPRVGGDVSFAVASPNAFGMIQGNALNSTNGQLANATVRLRDARYGRIIGSQVTDQVGLFTFKNLDPGSYVVELIGNDDTILAASQVINVNAGDAVSAIVKLPFRIPPYANALGSSTPNSAFSIVSMAAATGLLAVTTVGEPTCFQ